MIKRTIEVSAEPAHLTSRLEQLLLMRDGQTVGSIPCEDIGVVVVDQQQTTYTHSALSTLAKSDAVLVVCGRDHLPVGVLLPLADHTQVVWRINEQIGISRPLRKRLWKQLIREKIHAQALMLPEACPARKKLLELSREVKSGDPSNVEAYAAKIYWANWLPEGTFRRDSDLPGINALLNYGYAILRAAMARSLVAAGLQPALGLCHSNRSNSFCLADDMMEPLRPLVDDRAGFAPGRASRIDATGEGSAVGIVGDPGSLRPRTRAADGEFAPHGGFARAMFPRRSQPVGDPSGLGREKKRSGRFLNVGQVFNLSTDEATAPLKRQVRNLSYVCISADIDVCGW